MSVENQRTEKYNNSSCPENITSVCASIVENLKCPLVNVRYQLGKRKYNMA